MDYQQQLPGMFARMYEQKDGSISILRLVRLYEGNLRAAEDAGPTGTLYQHKVYLAEKATWFEIWPQEEFPGIEPVVSEPSPTGMAAEVQQQRKRIRDFQKEISDLKRAVERKDMKLRSSQVFNTTWKAKQLSKEHATVKARAKQLEDSSKAKDQLAASQAERIRSLENEVRRLRADLADQNSVLRRNQR
ncbi:hypothetical protein LZ554_000187 [Drepanopeziza brunnea f. sp. 'monogermtubi']|nr:hypothetical protein LZ554_000187 [Drepanopeziza brunnea f. sp. 'monogermtubi']